MPDIRHSVHCCGQHVASAAAAAVRVCFVLLRCVFGNVRCASKGVIAGDPWKVANVSRGSRKPIQLDRGQSISIISLSNYRTQVQAQPLLPLLTVYFHLRLRTVFSFFFRFLLAGRSIFYNRLFQTGWRSWQSWWSTALAMHLELLWDDYWHLS